MAKRKTKSEEQVAPKPERTLEDALKNYKRKLRKL